MLRGLRPPELRGRVQSAEHLRALRPRGRGRVRHPGKRRRRDFNPRPRRRDARGFAGRRPPAGDADDAAAEAFASGGAPRTRSIRADSPTSGFELPRRSSHTSRVTSTAPSRTSVESPFAASPPRLMRRRRRRAEPSRRAPPQTPRRATRQRFPRRRRPPPASLRHPRGERRRGRPGSILGLRRIDPAPRRRIERRRGIDRRRRGSRAASVRAPRARGGARVVRARRGGAQGAERGCSNRATKRRRVWSLARRGRRSPRSARPRRDRSRARREAPRAIADSVWEPSTGLSSAARARARVWARGAAWAGSRRRRI